MGVVYIVAGLYHFINPKVYLKIMPPYLPLPLPLVYLSGAAEMICGASLFFPETRSLAAWGIVLILIAVYPANIYMWTHNIKIAGKALPLWGHILRLLAQMGLIFWAYCYT